MTVKLYNSSPGKVTALLLGELPKGSSITDGQQATLTWTDGRSVRKITQNSLYWKFINDYCLPIIREQYDPTINAEEIHEALGRVLIPVKRVINGKSYHSRQQTSEMSISDFSDYFNKAIHYAGSEWDIPVEIFVANYEQYKKEMGL